MTVKLSRRGFLLGTTALAASSSAVTRELVTPAPAGTMAAAPMTAAEVTKLQLRLFHGLEEALAQINRATMDTILFGRGGYRVDRDPKTGAIAVEHVELDKILERSSGGRLAFLRSSQYRDLIAPVSDKEWAEIEASIVDDDDLDEAAGD